jgi:DNA polymerase III delta prime subunit
VKQPPPPIEEATQETDPKEEVEQELDEPDELALTKIEDEPEKPEEGADAQGNEDSEDAAMEDQQEEQAEAEAAPADEEDEEDVRPVTRRTRSRANAVAQAEAEGTEVEPETTRSTRLMRKSRLRSKKSLQEPSSDFEPGDESGEGEASGTEPSKSGDVDDDAESTPTRRGRGSRAPSRRSRRNRNDSGDEEVELDKDEMAEELEELRESSRSRPRRTRRRSPSIQYEGRATKKRRTKPVNYSIPAIDPAALELEEDDGEPVATPARNRRNGGAAGGRLWERTLNTTYGPFGGGGGAGALLGGPWGTGATGGVESDSSDDELVQRSGIGGTVGMTPTTAAPAVGLFNPLGQTHGDGGGGIGGATPQVGKVKNQKAFADADPLGVDMSVDFSKVGGLQGHIDQLKEMVQLPLLYPELFQKFHVTPPRGVLFHGPPGTGKTLLARALANSVGTGGRKISFYMRKGADALSKWVGEAEKQLRLLFEEARRTQPSIIFFDEIDGLAPVRSSKQEQIHASIVSTLLALMDGMDGRGQVIVIGATNRPDNIDPALRRPGRFDREFYFPLPDLEARRSILDIHTKDWGISDEFKSALAENTKGYGGADLRALCTEAALNAIQRTYPQIYTSKEKLVVDPDKITIHASDFMISVKKMIPSSERSTSSSAHPLPRVVEPLLRNQYKAILRVLDSVLPRPKKTTALQEAMYEPFEDADHGFGREAMHQEFERSRIYRPRLLIAGTPGMGQNYLAAAILHYLEGVHVQTMDLATLLGDGRVSQSQVG